MTKAISRRHAFVAGFALSALIAASPALAQKKYGPGVTDTEIKVGNIMPYSGPASAYGVIGKTEQAYVDMLNADGGVNGRKITFMSYDDAYSPPKAVEHARKLVESDEVLLVFNPLGTPSNTAILKYMNAKKVPHLFVATGRHGVRSGERQLPGPWAGSRTTRARDASTPNMSPTNIPTPRSRILYQNDDFGKDYGEGLQGRSRRQDLADRRRGALRGFRSHRRFADRQTEGRRASTCSTIRRRRNSRRNRSRSSRRSAGNRCMCWATVSASVGSVIKPAGFENSQGIISASYAKDPDDPQWKDDAGYKKWLAFMDKWAPAADKSNSLNVYGYNAMQTLEHGAAAGRRRPDAREHS
jgi:branched-chain amino acid transport system substrate-binding protein